MIVYDIDKFKFVDPKTDKLILSGTVYSYNDLDSITIRARNQYMDIKFKKQKKMLSEFVLLIVKSLLTNFTHELQRQEITFRLCLSLQ